MEKIFNWISLVVGVIGGFLANILGGFDAMLMSLLMLVILDYITGVIKGVATKKLSSEVGFAGLIKKIMIFLVIAVSVVIQRLVGQAVPIREMIIMFYVSNEGISLLENVAEFIPLPKKLKDILIQLREKSNEG